MRTKRNTFLISRVSWASWALISSVCLHLKFFFLLYHWNLFWNPFDEKCRELCVVEVSEIFFRKTKHFKNCIKLGLKVKIMNHCSFFINSISLINGASLCTCFAMFWCVLISFSFASCLVFLVDLLGMNMLCFNWPLRECSLKSLYC